MHCRNFCGNSFYSETTVCREWTHAFSKLTSLRKKNQTPRLPCLPLKVLDHQDHLAFTWEVVSAVAYENQRKTPDPCINSRNQSAHFTNNDIKPLLSITVARKINKACWLLDLSAIDSACKRGPWRPFNHLILTSVSHLTDKYDLKAVNFYTVPLKTRTLMLLCLISKKSSQ